MIIDFCTVGVQGASAGNMLSEKVLASSFGSSELTVSQRVTAELSASQCLFFRRGYLVRRKETPKTEQP